MSRKYQTMESIFDAIDRDYAWRLVELSEIKKAVQVAKGRAVDRNQERYSFVICTLGRFY